MLLLRVCSENGDQVLKPKDIIQRRSRTTNHRSLLLLLNEFADFDGFIRKGTPEVLHFVTFVNLGLMNRDAPRRGAGEVADVTPEFPSLDIDPLLQLVFSDELRVDVSSRFERVIFTTISNIPT